MLTRGTGMIKGGQVQEHEHDVMPQSGTVYAWNGLASDGRGSSDYPLTANCTCGQFIVRSTPGAPWRHRAQDDPPITGPSDEGWLATVEETIEALRPPVTLTELKHHWGSAYRITYDGRGCWSARRRDGRGMFTARSGTELRDKIRLDYAADEVPRRLKRGLDPGSCPQDARRTTQPAGSCYGYSACSLPSGGHVPPAQTAPAEP